MNLWRSEKSHGRLTRLSKLLYLSIFLKRTVCISFTSPLDVPFVPCTLSMLSQKPKQNKNIIKNFCWLRYRLSSFQLLTFLVLTYVSLWNPLKIHLFNFTTMHCDKSQSIPKRPSDLFLCPSTLAQWQYGYNRSSRTPCL